MPCKGLAFILFLFAASAQAQFDVGLGSVYRQSPRGFAADLDLGYGVLLWGEAPRGERSPDPLYGYARTELTATGAPNYSGWSYQFQFFPVAFAGVVAGQSFADNENEYDAFECAAHLCRGEFREDFTEGRLALSAWRLFLTARFRSSTLRENNGSALVTYISPENAIAVRTGEDKVKRSRVTLGFKWDDQWSVIASHMVSRAAETGQESRFLLGGVYFTSVKKTFTASLQGGTFVGENGEVAPAVPKKNAVTGIFLVRWTPLPSIGLF